MCKTSLFYTMDVTAQDSRVPWLVGVRLFAPESGKQGPGLADLWLHLSLAGAYYSCSPIYCLISTHRISTKKQTTYVAIHLLPQESSYNTSPLTLHVSLSCWPQPLFIGRLPCLEQAKVFFLMFSASLTQVKSSATTKEFRTPRLGHGLFSNVPSRLE